MLIKLILPYKTSKKTVQQSLSPAICMLGTVPILFFPSNRNNLEFTRNLFNCLTIKINTRKINKLLTIERFVLWHPYSCFQIIPLNMSCNHQVNKSTFFKNISFKMQGHSQLQIGKQTNKQTILKSKTNLIL